MNALAKKEIRQLLRIVETDDGRLDASKTLLEISRRFNLGADRRTHVLFSDADRVTAHKLLLSKGVDPATVTSQEYGTAMTGAEALSQGIYEKHVGTAPKAGRVSIKALPGMTLAINGQNIHLPARAHLNIALVELRDLDHDCFLVVENYESFDEIHRVVIAAGGKKPLVVYRGDPKESRADVVNALLIKFGLPVFVFGDLDPKGLMIAISLPFFAGLVMPRTEDLIHLFSKYRRHDLYSLQIGEVKKLKNYVNYAAIASALHVISTHNAGLVQQVWLGKPYTLHMQSMQNDLPVDMQLATCYAYKAT